MTNLSQHDRNEIASLLSFKKHLTQQRQQLKQAIAEGADAMNAYLELRRNSGFWK